MIKKEIKTKLSENNYNFLNSEYDLKNTIYLVACGSYGYGTYNEKSDLDLRGVLVESPKYLYGLESFEQFENLETDTVIYGLKKFIKLCINGNPNTLEYLGVEEDCIVNMTYEGELLRDNVELFFSEKIIHSFGNYAVAQLRRLQNALARDSYPQKEKEIHILNTMYSQMLHFHEKYTAFESNSINLYLNKSNKKTIDEEIFMDINLNNYPLRDFVSIYSEMSNIVKTYNKLNKRNKKKDEPHLYKHVMHLIRSLITGKDILDGKGIKTFRKDERQFLLDIRNGIYSFDDIFKIVDEYQKKFEESASKTKLPHHPDDVEIEKLMIKIYNSIV